MMGNDFLGLADVAAFAEVARAQSFTRAADLLGTSQSAISLRIHKLERRLGRRLLERTPRRVSLTADGAIFLKAANALIETHRAARDCFDVEPRRLRLGISDHLVGTDLSTVLKRVALSDPALAIEVQVTRSRTVIDAFDAGTLDAAIVLAPDSARRDGAVIGRERFLWVAAGDYSAGPPLRLATHSDACAVRKLATRALDEAGVPWITAFVGGGLGTVGAAVFSGLAVAAMGQRTVPRDCIDVEARLSLPPLPILDIVLHSATTDARTRAALAVLAASYADARPRFDKL